MQKMNFVTKVSRPDARRDDAPMSSGLVGNVVGKLAPASSAKRGGALKAVSGLSLLGVHGGVLPDAIFDVIQRDDG